MMGNSPNNNNIMINSPPFMKNINFNQNLNNYNKIQFMNMITSNNIIPKQNNMNNMNMINNNFFPNNLMNNFNPMNQRIFSNNNFPVNIKINSCPNNNSKKLNQIIGIESVIPINIVPKNIISEHEYDVITQVCIEAIKEKRKNVTQYCTQKIMNKINGQWFILICHIKDNNFEFKFSKIKEENILIFQYSEKIVYVCRLK